MNSARRRTYIVGVDAPLTPPSPFLLQNASTAGPASPKTPLRSTLASPKSSTPLALPGSAAPMSQFSFEFHQSQAEPNIENSRTVMSFLCTMWKQGMLFDCEITTADKKLYAHRAVLGAYSEMALENFIQNSNISGMNTTQHTLDLSEFPSQAIHQIITFLYTASMELTDNTIYDVLRASKKLQMICVTDFCLHYLSQFHVNNCMLYHTICTSSMETSLGQTIYDFICDNFGTVSQTQSFLEANKETVQSLLKEDCLRVSSELVVLDAAVRWIEMDQNNRSKFAADLLDCFRVPLVSPEDIVTKVEKHPFLIRVPGATEKLYRAMCYHCLHHSNDSLATQYAALPRLYYK